MWAKGRELDISSVDRSIMLIRVQYIRRNSNCFLIVFILLWWMIA